MLYWVFFRKCGSSKALVRWKAKSWIDRLRAGGGEASVCMYVCVLVGGGAVVCLTDAGLPARRRAKDQRGRRGWGKRAARCRRDTNITLWPSVQHTHIASTRLNVADEICQRGKQHDQDWKMNHFFYPVLLLWPSECIHHWSWYKTFIW